MSAYTDENDRIGVYSELDMASIPFASTGNESLTNFTYVNIEHVCAPLVHPVTGKTIIQYINSRQTPYYTNYGTRRGEKNLAIWHKSLN